MEIKLIIEGTEYKMNPLNDYPGLTNTPMVLFDGKEWIGEAIPNKPKDVFLPKGSVVKDTWTDTFYNKDPDGWWKRDDDTAGYSIHNEEIGDSKRYKLMPFGCSSTVIDLPNPDWEVRMLKGTDGYLYPKLENGNFSPFSNGNYTLQQALKLNFKIFSVKRIFDGSLFTVSDFFQTENGKVDRIKKFEIMGHVILACGENCSRSIKLISHEPKIILLTTEEGIKVYDPGQPIFICLRHPFGSNSTWKVNAISCTDDHDLIYFHSEVNRDQYIADNSPKIPLFTTEDGIEIFTQCNKLFIVHNGSLEISKGFVDFQFDKSKEMNYHYKPEFNKYFVSELKAKEYILLNKPIQVSYKQLDDYIEMRIRQTPCPTKREIIKEFFKSKINS